MRHFSKLRAVGALCTTVLLSQPAVAENHVASDALTAAAPLLAQLREIADVANATPFAAAVPLMAELATITQGALYHNVTLFFATNRTLSDVRRPRTPAHQFTATMGALNYGVADVSIPKNHTVGHLETQGWIEALRSDPNPQQHVILQAMQVQPADDVIEKMAKILENKGTSTLFYIHGFNVGVDTAARRAGQLTYDLDWTGPSFFFSWPSLDRPDPFAYNSDKDAARGSKTALQSVLERVAATDTDRIVIIAHSMGTDLLAQALELMEAGNSEALNKIDTVILAAPDIDENAFRTTIVPAIQGITEQNPDFTVTVYASASDKALGISSTLASGNARIGAMSRVTEEQRTAFAPVFMVDASAAETNLFGHTYINDNPSVIEDVYCMLEKGPDPTERASLEGVPVPEGPGFRIPERGRNGTLDNSRTGLQFRCD